MKKSELRKKTDYSLYLVTDRLCLSGKDLFHSVEEAIKGGVTVGQLREKTASSREFYQIGLKLKEITRRHNIPLIINDRVDIALALDAEGVHVGQDDLDAQLVRKLLGQDKILGVSAKTLSQATKAIESDADYIGVGAIFPTSTKADASELSLLDISDICSKINIPVLGIGGINQENISKLKSLGLDGICVVSAILGQADCLNATKNLRQSVDNLLKI